MSFCNQIFYNSVTLLKHDYIAIAGLVLGKRTRYINNATLMRLLSFMEVYLLDLK